MARTRAMSGKLCYKNEKFSHLVAYFLLYSYSEDSFWRYFAHFYATKSDLDLYYKIAKDNSINIRLFKNSMSAISQLLEKEDTSLFSITFKNTLSKKMKHKTYPKVHKFAFSCQTTLMK